MGSREETGVTLSGGSPLYGVDVGIILLEATFPRPPGDVAHAATFPFPVLYEIVDGASPRRVVEGAAEGLLAAFVEAADRLVACGVRAVTTCCGFLAIYQRELASAVPVPVAASSLLQIPQVLRMIRPDERICVVTMDATSLDTRHFDGVGVSIAERDRLSIIGLETTRELHPTIIGGGDTLDVALAQEEILEVASRAVNEDPAIGAFVFECTNLPPYAAAVQAATNRPVFDAVTMITWLRNAAHPRHFA